MVSVEVRNGSNNLITIDLFQMVPRVGEELLIKDGETVTAYRVRDVMWRPQERAVLIVEVSE